MTPSAGPETWVWLARIRRPQGRKGEVFADILTDFPEKFAQRKRLWLLPQLKPNQPSQAKAADSDLLAKPGNGGAPDTADHREVELIAHWLHKGGVVLHFAGVDSISAAEMLSGRVVAIPLEERAPLTEDEVYIGDLIGCALVDVSAESAPTVVGVIDEVDRTAGPVPLLVVEGAAGEVLIPFAKSYLRKLDLDGKRVEVALPEGLVDLNLPDKS